MNKITPRFLDCNSIFSKGTSYFIQKSVVKHETSLHQHEFFEFDIIISGQAQSMINNREYKLVVGDMVFLSPSDHHSYCSTGSETLTLLNIVFPVNLIYSAELIHVPFDSAVSHLSEKELMSIKAIGDIALERFENKDPLCDQYIKACIEWIFLCITSSSPDTLSDRSNSKNEFAPALAYIHENFSNINLRRADVAKIMNMSPTHFSKCFHSAVGIPFQNYLLNLRLNYANCMLKTTDLSLSQIAASSGFSSDCYFSKMYKSRFGIAPGKTKRFR